MSVRSSTGPPEEKPPAAGEPLTVIVGRTSNLTERLTAGLTGSVTVSARRILADPGWRLPARAHRLVINSFQPATALTDLHDPIGYIDLAVGVTARLLDLLPGSMCSKVLYTSSSSVYGDNVRCSESQPAAASSLHAALKLANEHLVAGRCGELGIDHTVLRLFNMYGGRDNFSVVSRLLNAVRQESTLTLNNHGNAVRDFVHIDDVVRSYLAVLEQTGLPIVNVATGVGVSVRTLVNELRIRGFDIRTQSRPRQEIMASVADVSVLSGIVDVAGFRDVIDDISQSLQGSSRGVAQ